MTASPSALRPLDHALTLARQVATRLGHADAEARTGFRLVLDQLGSGPGALRRLRDGQAGLADRLHAELAPALDDAFTRLEAIDTALDTRDRAVAVAAWRAEVLPYFLRVPLCRRTLDKPLGYPGDYGMVQMIFEEPDGAADPLGRALARYAWGVGPARAHRQRRPWAIGHLEAAREASGRPLRVLSYACGPEHTLRAWMSAAPDTVVHLYDTETRALEWCSARFGEEGHAAQVRTHLLQPGELVDGTADLVAAAPVDVALVLGLFDYLTPEAIGALVDRLASVLAPGGRLLCTNLNADNPWRAFMEYVGAWQVRHRSVDELVRLVVRDRADLAVIDARVDDSGTNAFVAIERRVAL